MKIYKRDPYKDKTLDRRKWAMISGGDIKIVNLDRRLYKGVDMRAYQKPGHKTRDGKPYYTIWIEIQSFKRQGHRFL